MDPRQRGPAGKQSACVISAVNTCGGWYRPSTVKPRGAIGAGAGPEAREERGGSAGPVSDCGQPRDGGDTARRPRGRSEIRGKTRKCRVAGEAGGAKSESVRRCQRCGAVIKKTRLIFYEQPGDLRRSAKVPKSWEGTRRPGIGMEVNARSTSRYRQSETSRALLRRNA